MHIDNKLTWKEHIRHIEGKVARGIGIITKSRKVLNSKALKTLYYSLVYPYFSYCNHIWGGAVAKTLRKLVLLQKRAVRTICSAKYRDHTEPLMEKLGLLHLYDVNLYVNAKFMYNWHHKLLPQVFEDSFVLVSDIHDKETRQSANKNVFPPKFRNDRGQNSYTYRCTILWNRILNIKINPDVSEAVFCKSIKQCIKVGLLKNVKYTT